MLNLVPYPRQQLHRLYTLVGLIFFWQLFMAYPLHSDLFTAAGWFPISVSWYAKHSALYKIFSGAETFFILLGIAASASLALRVFPRISAAILWLAITALVARNPYFSDFDQAYLGWLLLAFLLIPGCRSDADKTLPLPALLIGCAWIVLGASYTCSGIDKLASPEWRDGMAISFVLAPGGIGRFALSQDFLSDAVVSGFLKFSSWSVLLLETFSLPMMLFRSTRRWAWLGMACVQVGIGTLTYLTELNIALLVFHYFLWDERWFRKETYPLRAEPRRGVA